MTTKKSGKTKRFSCIPLIHTGIKKMMEEKGVRQVDIDNISESYASRVVNGERQPTLQTLEGICQKCGVDICDFFAVYMKPLMSDAK